ncbi:MAG: S4 domain-containing protein [Gemmatimonadales bacterium]|jgi:ribosome-associated heat shock protein Hsp15|nr:S4 domain-containing protein [Gemmatimonadales bacterium]
MSRRDRDEADDGPNYRLDKWLWAARFFKTRALAAEAIAGGKVELNGEHPKRGREVRVGDELRIRLGPYEHLVVVQGLAVRRGPAAEAQRLYGETAASLEARQRLAERLRSAPPPLFTEKGRPTKKERRDLRRLKDGEW